MEKQSKKSQRNTDYTYTGDLPLGLGMALTHNIPAMKVFATLPEESRREYIRRAEGLSTRVEMADLVSTLLNVKE